MRYLILLFLMFLFMFTNSVYSFSSSESNLSNFSKKEKTLKNNSKEHYKEKEKIIKQNKKEVKKAIRKAIFENVKPKLVKKRGEKKGLLEDDKNPSTISIIAFIAGFIFFLSIVSILFVSIYSTLFGVFVYLIIGSLPVGVIAGMIGLLTKDEAKHDIKKTKLLSLIGLFTGLVAVLLLVLIALLAQ